MAQSPEGMYPHCQKYGISPKYMDKDLPEVKCMTNALVMELSSIRSSENYTWQTFHSWIQALLGKRYPCTTEAPSTSNLRAAVVKLEARRKSLRKRGDANLLGTFDSEEFVLPGRRHKHSAPSTDERVETVHPEVEIYKQVNLQLAKELAEKSQELLTVEQKYDKLRQQHEMSISRTRNKSKAIKRRDLAIQNMEMSLQKSEQLLATTKEDLKSAEMKVSGLRQNKKLLNQRIQYWKEKAHFLANTNDDETVEELIHYHEEIGKLNEEITRLESDNIQLKEQVEGFLESDDIISFEGGKYSDDIRACYYELMSMNVGLRNIESIIRSVLSKLAHKRIGRLPSYSLTSQMLVESLVVAQAQLGETLASSQYKTLHSDGTTKFGEHYGAVEVSTESGSYTVGIRNMFTGSAQNTLEVFKEIVQDIDEINKSLGRHSASAKIVASIKNTMSDRHVVEKNFNQLLEDYRSEVLPIAIEDWATLSDEEKAQMQRMNNFFCGLHFIIGLADSAEVVLKQWESTVVEPNAGSRAITENRGYQSSESATQRLIRTTCKAFNKRGSEQAGCPAQFATYLRTRGIAKVPLVPFIGNRFNIIFYDAAGVYYLKDHILEFFQTQEATNRLLRSVEADLCVPELIASCKALGLIDKFVTGPLWRVLEDSTISVLEMSEKYAEMEQKFIAWSADSSALLMGDESLYGDTLVHRDEVLRQLLQPSEYDILVQEVLQLIFTGFLCTTRRMLIDHLPGGLYSNSDDRLQAETASVPKTNIVSERDFAMLDRQVRLKPNATFIALEAVIMYANNQTQEWVEEQTAGDRQKLFALARKKAKSIKQQFHCRRQLIEQQRAQKQEEQLKSRERKRLKDVQEKEKWVDKLQVYGLWKSNKEIKEGLMKLSKTKQKDAIVTQIQFRQKVLQQTHEDHSVFHVTKDRNYLTIEQLTENLCKLLVPPTVADPLSSSYISKEALFRHPERLCGRRIEHLFFDEECESTTWWRGTVLSVAEDSGEDRVMYMYKVTYDDEDGVIHKYPLLEDLQNGDLKLI